MRVDLHKRDAGMLANTLVAVAILLGAAVLAKVGVLLAVTRQAEGTVTFVLDSSSVDATDPSAAQTQVRAAVERLKKENLFVKAPPRQHPVSEVAGILGSEVLIDGKWYKAGDTVGDAKILAVGPTTVRIAWDGQEKDFAPIGAGPTAGPSGRRPPGSPLPSNRPATVVTGEHRGQRRQGGPQLSAEERASLRDRKKTVSPEERERARKGFRERVRQK